MREGGIEQPIDVDVLLYQTVGSFVVLATNGQLGVVSLQGGAHKAYIGFFMVFNCSSVFQYRSASNVRIADFTREAGPFRNR